MINPIPTYHEQDGKIAILIQDPQSGIYTSFYKEDPAAVAEGETIEEALKKLDRSYQVLIKWRKDGED